MYIYIFFLIIPISLFSTTVTVTGVSKQSFPADRAQITLSVITEDKTPSKTLKENTIKMGSFQSFLKKEGVDKEAYTVRALQLIPRYSYKDGVSTLESYQAQNSIVLTLEDFSRLRSILSQAPSQGINRIENLSFFSTTRGDFENRVLKEAVKDGFTQAKACAEAAGLIVGAVKEMKVSPSPFSPTPRFLLKSASPELPLPEPEISIEKSVEITFTLEKQ